MTKKSDHPGYLGNPSRHRYAKEDKARKAKKRAKNSKAKATSLSSGLPKWLASKSVEARKAYFEEHPGSKYAPAARKAKPKVAVPPRGKASLYIPNSRDPELQKLQALERKHASAVDSAKTKPAFDKAIRALKGVHRKYDAHHKAKGTKSNTKALR